MLFSPDGLRRLVLRGLGVAAVSAAGVGVASAAQVGVTVSSGPPPAVTVTASSPSISNLLTQVTSPITNTLGYAIHTKGGAGCATDKVTQALYGVPTPVDVGGSALPDVTVLVAPIPTVPGVNNPTVLSLTVTRLTLTPLPAEVEAIIAPSGLTDPSRVNLGYDGCESTAPALFSTQVTEQPTHLQVAMQPTSPGANLKVLAGAFTQPTSGNVRVNPTEAVIRVAPVPSQLQASVDILPSSTYKAHITVPTPTSTTVDYVNVAGASSTTAHLTLGDLPKTTDVQFSPLGGTYALSAPVNDATLLVTTTDGTKTQLVDGHLTALPVAASFLEDGPTHGTFTSSSAIGDATVRYASWAGATPTLPAKPVLTSQYVVASVKSALTVADLHLAGIGTTSAVGWGDDIALDLVHTAGPFDVDVATDTVHVTGAIRDLPSSIHVTYANKTQSATYTGNGVIGSMTFDATTTGDPFVGRARSAHLALTGVPTGLSTTLNSAGETFTTAMAAGAQLGKVELTLSDGSTAPLPAGDGLVYSDASPTSPYFLFLRTSGLHSATFGWGDPIAVGVDHTAGPFDVNATIGTDTAGQVLTVAGHLGDLPGVAHFAYYPAHAGGVLTQAKLIGGGPVQILQPTISRITYGSDSPMHSLTLNVDSTTPLTHDATHLQAALTDLPTSLDLDFDKTDDTFKADATITGPALGRAVACVSSSAAVCGTSGLPDAQDGAHLVDHTDGVPYLAELHLGGLSGASVSYDASAIHLNVGSAGNSFHVLTDAHSADADGVVQTQTVDATIADLPTSVDLTYATDSKTVTYTGSSTIGELTAHVANSPDAIVGGTDGGPGAHFLDATLTRLPQALSLRLTPTDPADGATGLTLDTGAQAIGHVVLDLSDHNPGLPDAEALLAGHGGIVIDSFTTQDDDRSPAEPYYRIFGDVQGLRHVDFSDVSYPATDDALFQEQLHGHATFDASHPLRILARKDGDASKADHAQYVQVDYATPPTDLDVQINHNEGTDGDPHTYRVDYTADGVGSGLLFSTNDGDQRSLLTAGLPDQVPTTVSACLGLQSSDCYPPTAKTDHGLSKFTSYALSSSPLPDGSQTHITVFDCKENASRFVNNTKQTRSLTPDEINDCDDDTPSLGGGWQYSGSRTDGDLFLTSSLKAMLATENCTPDCQVVQLDTASTQVHGSLVERQAGDTDRDDYHLGAFLPVGFKAHDWFQEIYCLDGCSGTQFNPHGQISCPKLMGFLSDALPISEANFVEELCPKTVIDSVDAAHLEHIAPGSANQLVRVHGQDFTVALDDDDAWFGTFKSVSGIPFIQPSGVQIHSITPVGYDEEDICLSVPAGTDDGVQGIEQVNPKGISDSVASSIFTVDSSAPVSTTDEC